jgi:hypothetical protein
MKQILRKVKRKLLIIFVSDYFIKEWVNSGRPVPPPHEYKQKVIRDYQKKNNINVLVETGTYLGDMVAAQKKFFKRIYSIELSEDLFKMAKERFKNDSHIKIIQGDSSEVLKNLLIEIMEPCIFWLDGHYSGGITAKGKKECPVFEELSAIFNSKNFAHVLLIDDARLFGIQNNYPTIKELNVFTDNLAKGSTFSVQDDIIRVCLQA